MRTHLMDRLEWKNNTRVLYVSIGTSTDLQFIPKNIDLKNARFCWARHFLLECCKNVRKNGAQKRIYRLYMARRKICHLRIIHLILCFIAVASIFSPTKQKWFLRWFALQNLERKFWLPMKQPIILILNTKKLIF